METRWWQLKDFWNFHPYLIGEDEPNLTNSIFFRWVETQPPTRRCIDNGEKVDHYLDSRFCRQKTGFWSGPGRGVYTDTLAHFLVDKNGWETVDGRNPKQPPGIYKTL